MTGREFLKASDYLLKRKEEAASRSAASRGYYAFFMKAALFSKNCICHVLRDLKPMAKFEIV